MNQEIYRFWSKHAKNNIKPNTGEDFPEGWHVVKFLGNLELEDVIEIGSGTGRLAKAFTPQDYLGLDISQEMVDVASEALPEYTFMKLSSVIKYPNSKTKLLYTVLLHQNDDDIERVVAELCRTTEERIVVAEIMDKNWRREGNPPVFNRDPETYIDLFSNHGKALLNTHIKPYERYKNMNLKSMSNKDTDITILVFDDPNNLH